VSKGKGGVAVAVDREAEVAVDREVEVAVDREVEVKVEVWADPAGEDDEIANADDDLDAELATAYSTSSHLDQLNIYDSTRRNRYRQRVAISVTVGPVALICCPPHQQGGWR